ncbi:hypothetical protein [Streptomyces exfoliatus]|uniref:hypothetical protein n=1 Tax=Streptomyces exfoliatus TaxID=1905 RepID=UPI003789D1F3
MKITLLICDNCKRRDRAAETYSLTIGDSEPVQRDLCEECAAPIVALWDLATEAKKLARVFQEPPVQDSDASKPPAKKALAKKTTAKTTATKKTAARRSRGTKSLTIEEINALKAAGKL